MQPAPFFADAAQGPAGGHALWARAEDGTRLRLAHWPTNGAARGTVFLFNGRSEYAEKYGPTAAALTRAGWHVATLDWRGQGLSDRNGPDPMLGHVVDFAEYQQDVRALLHFARTRSLPEPFHLLSHSMGGCIALRSLHDGLPFRSTVFSAPMWGIKLFPTVEPLAVTLSRLAHQSGQGHRLTPTTTRISYVLHAPFRGNLLTRDPDMYHWMRQHLTTHPDLALGGPSLTWLHAAFTELKALARLPSPPIPALIALGSAERIICPRAIRQRLRNWGAARLDLYRRAEHEVMMETPAHRDRFHTSAVALFASAA